MNPVDLTVFVLYFLVVLGIGVFFYFRNKGADEYYIGGRKMGYSHVGLSVVATDVGGGFSIGLGGLGFVMGISGSWMLFTGLLGAWLAAVLLIPKVKNLSTEKGFYTMPEVFNHFFNARVALLAGIISAIGYVGFSSSQMLAGARLASASFDGVSLEAALYIMAFIIIVYTVMGGIKAVIYTDTFQWILLLGGLIFIGLPIGYISIGGIDAIRETVDPEMLTLTNISWQQFVNWGVTILPIWFVGMTLYQRIYATRTEKEAQKAWYLAGLLEWPVMAFMGVLLGLFAKVAADQGMFAYMGYEMASEMHQEEGLPMLLRTVLPVGLMGLMMSAYFSAIMSTADSCLVAASGNVTTDIIEKVFGIDTSRISMIRLSQLVTLALGLLAFMLAAVFDTVLQIMLYSYAFMVSALLVPIIGGIYWKRSSNAAALWAMIVGGVLTLGLTIFSDKDLPFEVPVQFTIPFGLDPIIFGLSASLIVFVGFSYLLPDKN
ncbi:sodium:solute symporter family protein [Natronogracilivirga saccharolytica]|uniref:Sodium:solute symporter family protein n=1 Tax=Natronogracilivirga saccharolytica TaxID=2812953 RepID=A0A8J7RPR1_9BACT|nr:sodium:solute symporter family protein [Natronogracilivirga saccharolytica]MBP3193669.1 sodium:solute symporter family protein [Natronogracilivirga saccharolytica]